jgi:hypothetical protein
MDQKKGLAEDLADFIELIMHRGVQLSIHATNGWFGIDDSNELFAYLNNEDAFCGKKHGVTEDHYKLWRDIANGAMPPPKCEGKTKLGKKCRNNVWPYIGDVREFDPNEKFCSIHRAE